MQQAVVMPGIPPHTVPVPEEGPRERKRRQMRQRVAEAGMRLFLTQGYQGTTLDAIAAEAGISRRAFFSYFKSKDEIILYWQDTDWAQLIADLLKTSPDVPPLEAVREVMVKHIARYTTEQMTTVDNLMRSSESLLALKQMRYLQQEQLLFQTLCEVWRQPERRIELRMVAIIALGATRLALQAWREQTGRKKPVSRFVQDAFDGARDALSS
jgi:AcrR family transcriptional regulator